MIHVFGPAYLDRVLRVGAALRLDGEPPLDQSVEGSLKPGAGLSLDDGAGFRAEIAAPHDWPGPLGSIRLASQVRPSSSPAVFRVESVGWQDDLGGMGAGYAAALGGRLVSALGGEADPISQQVSRLLQSAGVEHFPIRVEDRTADWTLLLTSGPHGDKLPIGFRGCHSAIRSLGEALHAAGSCQVRVVASFPNRLAAEALRFPGARVRVFAPAMRNMTDQEVSVHSFAEYIDVLCCNRQEWESLERREQVAWQVGLLVVTDGPRGALVRFTTPEGEPGRMELPAFPRARPPQDTNRAGEAFASTLIAALLEDGWGSGVWPRETVADASRRASAAAALVLDRLDFGFPSTQEIDAALLSGRVA